MAVLSGVTVSCIATGAPTLVGQLQHLPSKLLWQEAPATGVATSNSAPSVSGEYGPVIFRLYSAVDAWVSYGDDPDSSASPRVFLPAETERDYIVQPGDKLMWQADA
jgi:hypothetical protein